MSLNSRKGYFTIRWHLLQNNLDAEFLKGIFADVIVVEAYNSFVEDIVEYKGYSKHFDEVPDYCEAPHYEAVLRSVALNPHDNPIVEFIGFKRIE